MKRIFSFIAALTFLFSTTAPLFAALPRSIEKITHGVKDVVTSPMELIDHTKKEVDSSKYKALGLISGLVKSPFHMVKKAGKGIMDVATFPID